MNQTPRTRTDYVINNEVSGISWGAILAGAAIAAALSMVFLILGAGLGFSAVSPWRNDGISAKALGMSAIAWLAFTQIAASGLGGYLTGRLRIRWTNVHRDEVHFRDTAHGLMTWAVASLLAVVVMATGLGNIADKSIDAGASLVSGVAGASIAAAKGAANSTDGDSLSYYIDALFRPDAARRAPPATAATPAETREVADILTKSIKSGALATDDRDYLGMVVSRHTGLSQVEANTRVDTMFRRASKAVSDVIVTAKQAADNARKAAAHTALWMVVALLCGAFVASLAALWGGKVRDHDTTPAALTGSAGQGHPF